MDVNSRDPLQNIIPFRIKGVEIGRFDSSGNLKIGTTTTLAPTVRLDISGGEARVNSGSVASTALTTTGRIGVNTATPTVSLDVSGAVQITASSVVATALTTRGRIGINTTSPPTSDLDVNGAVIMRSTLNLSNSLTLPTGFWHKSSDNVERLQYITSGNTIFKSGNAFLWYDSNNAVRMFLSNSGLLGIGHSSPAYALHIEGGAAYINSNSANNTALVTTGRIGVNTATPTVALDVSGAARMAASSATATALTTTGRIGVNTAAPTVDLDVSGAARMAASSATATALTTVGRIGVNTATPTADLDVSGAARMSASSATATALTTVGRIGVNTATPTVDLDVSGAARMAASSATATALTTVGRIGVNTATPTVDLEVNGLAKLGNVNIIPLYVFTSHTFTNAGATGRHGPTLITVRTAYSSVSWAQDNSYLSMTNNNGIQLWTVPISGNYTIRAKGAAGLDTRGGKGRDIQLTTTLIKGEVIRILVGQQGTVAGNFSSGGGGTFVVRDVATPIIVAGGGGGQGDVMAYPNNPFSDANIGTAGNTTPGGWYGGGNGGTPIRGRGDGQQQGGGGGFDIDNYAFARAGTSFTSGGAGGLGTVDGGFGGGGGTYVDFSGGGGGGGYSGGGGGGTVLVINWDNLGGGGGGSYGITTLFDRGAINTDHGSVEITLTTPSVALEVIGVAVLTASSATSTALTTTGRIGVNTAAPTTDLDVTGAARLTASSATATALTTTGRIGVNTTTPSVALDVNGAAKVSTILSAQTGVILGDNTKTAMDFGPDSSTGCLLNLFDNGGSKKPRIRFVSGTNDTLDIGCHANGSFIWSNGDRSFGIATNNTPRFTITGAGKVEMGEAQLTASSATATALTTVGWIGVNTATPQYPVDIVGLRNAQTTASGKWFGTSSSPGNVIASNNIDSSVPISMRLNGSVWIESVTAWVGFWVASDRRIKKNINYNISSECLNLFRQLKCSNYSYIDERANKTNVYGYIAQDVSTVIPYAVTTQKGFIPSLYSLAKISKENGIVKLTCYEQKTYTFHSLHDNQGKAFINDNNEPASDNEGGRHFKVKLYDASMNEYIIRINEILDNGVFTIENDETSIKLTHDEYFVFGQEVDDYKILNNEAIAIVATAALQEVDRQQQADKARIAELEATVASQQSLINDILERLNKSGL